jgi:hypothetical protein
VHALSSQPEAEALRVVVTATNGDQSARIVSLRIY